MADDDLDGRQEFLVPSIVDGVDEAWIVNWRIAIGDWLIIGRPMCTIESGGFVRELISPFVGQVTALAAAVGELVAVGDVLVAVADEDAGMNTELDAETGEVEAEVDVEVVESEPKQARAKHSPLVRRLAEEFDIDLATVEGTGSGGRITRDDVHRAAFPGEPLPGTATTGPTADSDAETDPEPPPVEAESPVEVEVEVELAVEPETGTDGEVDSDVDVDVGESPGIAVRSVFSVGRRVDAGQLLRAHERLRSQAGQQVSLDALLIKLVYPVAAEFPEFVIDGGNSVDIGFCRSVETGMLTDVVTEVGTRSIQDLDLVMKDLERSHLVGDEPIVAPLTLLDAGPLGASTVTPPLPVGGIGCVAFGAPEQALHLADGISQVSTVLTITGTFDEQAIQLGRAAALLERIATYIEDPILAFAG